MGCCGENRGIEINHPAPLFEAQAFHNGEIKTVKLADYRSKIEMIDGVQKKTGGKWVVLFFYPADFTFICPTELGEMADYYQQFQEMDVEILSISTDTVFVHKAWHDASETIKKIRFPMVADPNGQICVGYNTIIPMEGLSLRGTFIIDPDGILKCIEMHDNSIGRSAKELNS